jgi:hypothetical protein
MLSKIYYGLGIGILLIYLIGTAAQSLRSKPVLQPLSFGPTKIEKGKYVPYTPSKNSSGSYDSDGGGGGYGGGGSKRSSFPTGGGYSGGK